jgi:putative hydrolase of the HAD superfamily
MIRAALVDLDDTLLDDRRSMTLAVTEFCLTHLQVTQADIPHYVDNWLSSGERHWKRFRNGEISQPEQRRARLRDLLERELPPAEADSLFQVYLSCYERSWQRATGVEAFLAQCSTMNLKMAIVSNGERSQVHRKLKVLGLEHDFNVVVTPEDAGAPKPDPRMFLRAAELLDVANSECIVIGDSLEADFLPARKLGMRAFHVSNSKPGRGIEHAVK